MGTLWTDTKYDNNGNELWAQALGGDNSQSNADYQGIHMYYDSITDFIFLAGNFWGTAQFGLFQLHSQSSDIFLAKYDLNGNCIWAKKYGGAGSDRCYALTVNSAGNILMSGTCNDFASFDTITIPAGGFLTQFDLNGNCSWAKQKFAFNPQYNIPVIMSSGIKCNDSDILLCGNMVGYDGIIHVDSITINHPGFFSCLLFCFDGSGNVKWMKEGISPDAEAYSNIALDSSGNIYYTGLFYDSVNFSGNHMVTGSGNSEMFVVKYNKTGGIQWAKKANADNAQGSDIVSDPAGIIYVTGFFSGFAGFDGFNITSSSSRDMFLSRYSTEGNCLGVLHISNSKGWGVSQDKDGNPIVSVSFHDTISIGSNTYTSYGNEDILVMKSSAIIGIVEKSMLKQTQLLIYANPTTGKCNIKIPEDFRHEKNLVLQIFDNNGKMIQNIPVIMDQEKISLNISAEAKGMYNAILSNGKKSYSGKIVFILASINC
jgi:hypothetical protein